jgi:chromosome segregation ATPase
MKKITLITTILVLLNIVPMLNKTWAITPARVTQIAQRMTIAPTKQASELTAIQKSADTMISVRITTLNNLLSRIQNDTRLSADDKTTLTTNINTMISNLQALKTKIDADTDVTTARADRKTIVTSYHIYVTFEPQIRLLITIDNLSTTSATVSSLVTKLQSLSTTLKGQGKDTTSMDAAITDINTQLTAINTILTTDKTKLLGITTSSNTNQATFVQIRQDLAKVRGDFAQIRHDIATIRADVQGLVNESDLKINASGSAHPTKTPTSTPTATPTP